MLARARGRPELHSPRASSVVLANTSGFVYYVSITGITGTRTPDTAEVAANVARIKSHTPLPVAVGFGVKTPEQAAAIGAVSDGVVVGSAIVSAIKDSLDVHGRAGAQTAPAVFALVRDLATGLSRDTREAG